MEKKLSSYEERQYAYGRVWTAVVLLMMILTPAAICLYYNVWPPLNTVLRALLGVAPMYWVVGVIEVFTYVPMLGTGGTYLGFVTGNLTSLKVPCALNAMEAAKVRAGTEEGEVISTIAIATSSIVTVLVIAAGVFGLRLMEPVLESPALKPAFDQILPSLFGALGVVFISKNPKIATAPMLFMVVLCLLVPSLAGSVSVLVPVGVLIAILSARVLYKKGLLDRKGKNK